MKPEGMLALMKWDEETPYMFFFKQGLDAEKVVSSSPYTFQSRVLISFFPFPLIPMSATFSKDFMLS